MLCEDLTQIGLIPRIAQKRSTGTLILARSPGTAGPASRTRGETDEGMRGMLGISPGPGRALAPRPRDEGNGRPGRKRSKAVPLRLSGRWRERPCRRAGHLRHPVHPVHPVSCRSPTGRDACLRPMFGVSHTPARDGSPRTGGCRSSPSSRHPFPLVLDAGPPIMGAERSMTWSGRSVPARSNGPLGV